MGWRVVAASVQGSSHARSGVACQDTHGWTIAAGDVLLAAVADGAGSALLAEDGARMALTTALATAERDLRQSEPAANYSEAFLGDLLQRSAASALAALTTEAETRSVAVTDFATTLTLVAATPAGIVSLQVGDGAVVWSDAAGGLRAFPRVQSGEYLNETSFLTSAGALERSKPAAWQGVHRCLAVLTDGLQMAALRMPDAEPHPGFFNPLFDFLLGQGDAQLAGEELKAFLNSPRLRQRSDDDLTLLLAALNPV